MVMGLEDEKEIDRFLFFWLQPTTMSDPTTYTTDSYFETQERPAGLDAEIFRVKEWVAKMKTQGKRIVLVTVSLPSLHFPLLDDFLDV